MYHVIMNNDPMKTLKVLSCMTITAIIKNIDDIKFVKLKQDISLVLRTREISSSISLIIRVSSIIIIIPLIIL
jgi:hypothetical protein